MASRRSKETVPLLGDASIPDPIADRRPANARSVITVGEEAINNLSSGCYETPVSVTEIKGSTKSAFLEIWNFELEAECF